MNLTITLTAQEHKLARAYAQAHSLSLEEAFKSALFEQIEDEYFAKQAEEAYAEFLKNPVTYSNEEVGKMLGIGDLSSKDDPN